MATPGPLHVLSCLLCSCQGYIPNSVYSSEQCRHFSPTVPFSPLCFCPTCPVPPHPQSSKSKSSSHPSVLGSQHGDVTLRPGIYGPLSSGSQARLSPDSTSALGLLPPQQDHVSLLVLPHCARQGPGLARTHDTCIPNPGPAKSQELLFPCSTNIK